MAVSLEKQLSESGYKLLGRENEKEELILSILKKGDLRYLKAIPFLIYMHDIDLENVYAKTKKKDLLAQIISVIKKIFKENGIEKHLPNIEKQGGLNYADFKQEFEMQKLASEKPRLMVEKQKIYAERDLQMWLSKLFARKEKQIIQSILEDKPVSRTDYEYYSRKTKKKLNAITNLQDFARTLASKSPKHDEDLFRLKKMIEEESKSSKSSKSVSLQRFFVSNNSLSSILSDGAIKITDLKRIKNKDILGLLEKYKEHDFT